MMLNFPPLPPPDHDAGVVWSVVGLVSVVLVATVAARIWWCDRRGSGGPTFVPRQFAAFWLGEGGLITSVTSLAAEAASFFSRRSDGMTGQSGPEDVAGGVFVGVGLIRA